MSRIFPQTFNIRFCERVDNFILASSGCSIEVIRFFVVLSNAWVMAYSPVLLVSDQFGQDVVHKPYSRKQQN